MWIPSLRGPFKRRVLQSLRHPKPRCLEVGEFLLVPLKAPENLVSRRGPRPLGVSQRRPPMSRWTLLVREKNDG
ncbi:hypothetical protein HPB47_021954 [Ixodes persulcatus]|uniref:Uncharacterized protein n=1 Tax=Ixodes persulcatus TaxID=34615 RepID=A0AC60R2Q1_IXOPE|nr:hypothetical protein HPB47_021954 [Ixodes persulcatus]